MMKFFFLSLALLSLSFTGVKGVMLGRNKTRSCSPNFSTISGNQSTTTFGKIWTTCSGFTCQAGYTPSNGSCIPTLTPNTTCFYPSTAYSTETPYCGPYTTSVASISVHSEFCLFGCTIMDTSFPYKLNFYCPNRTHNSTWTYNEQLTAISIEILTWPTNYVMYANSTASYGKSAIRMGQDKRLYGIQSDFIQYFTSDVCTQL